MRVDEMAVNAFKIVGFFLIAVAVGIFVWHDFNLTTRMLTVFVLGILFSAGAFFMMGFEAPTEEELKEAKKGEVDKLYLPSAFKTFDKKTLRQELLHRSKSDRLAQGNFAGHRGH